MKRRDFIAGLGGAAVVGPRGAWGQPQSAMPVIGFLSGASPNVFVASIHRGLKDAGFVEGHNLKVEYRWAGSRYDQLPALAKELVDLKVGAIVTFGANEAGLAAKAATSTIPVVFSAAEDPIASGLVVSLSRPEGNLTGVTWMGADLLAKGVELIHELLPHVAEVGLLLNPGRRRAANQVTAAQEAAARVGKKIRTLNAGSSHEIDEAFAILTKEGIRALVIASEPLFFAESERIVALAGRQALPTAYNLSDGGTRPSDLPVQRSTKVELALNLKTAKTLGLTFPITLLGRADEVIE